MSDNPNSTPDQKFRKLDQFPTPIDSRQFQKICEVIKVWEQDGYTFDSIDVWDTTVDPPTDEVYDPVITVQFIFVRDNHFYTEELVIPGFVPVWLNAPQYNGYVYLLQSPTGAYKIGRTKDPKNRLKTFSVQLPFEVEFIHLIPAIDMVSAEKQLQEMFADKHINGEWYRLDPADVEYIKGIEQI